MMTTEEKTKLFDILAGMQGSMLEMNKRMGSVENGTLKLNVWKETVYEQKHQALLEGQALILEQLVPKPASTSWKVV